MRKLLLVVLIVAAVMVIVVMGVVAANASELTGRERASFVFGPETASVAGASASPVTVSAVPFAATAKVRVANVVGFRMDRATRTLHDQSLRVNEECSGLFGCIIKSRWWVCHQSP